MTEPVPPRPVPRRAPTRRVDPADRGRRRGRAIACRHDRDAPAPRRAGLVTYEPYEDATLTDEGRETVAELCEAYTTLSAFFRDVLDIEDHEGEAARIAGTISPGAAEWVASMLPLEASATPALEVLPSRGSDTS